MEPTTNHIDRKRSVHADPTPDWRRHPKSVPWHFGAESSGSFVTWCSGRWPIGEEIATSDRPPYLDRCDRCERSRIDVVRIEIGLRELERNAPPHYDWPGSYELGGEG